MELRTYLDILARRRWLVIMATVVVAAVAGITSSLRTPLYRATASVLLRPGDPSEQLSSQTQTAARPSADADRYAAAQIDIIRSKAVAEAAVADVKGATPTALLHEVSAAQSGSTDVIRISATDPDAARARLVANAFAHAYIENRRQFAVGNLQRAEQEVEAKLNDIGGQIAKLDSQIEADEQAQVKEFNAKNPLPAPKPTTITLPIDGAPQVQIPGPTPVRDTFTPTPDQALSAARYAAALQYQSLYAQQENLLVTMSLKRGEAELIAEADLPGAPASPKPKRDAPLGGIVGLLLGLGIAFLREQLDDRIHSRDEAEEASGLPVLVELPFEDESARRPAELTAQLRPAGGLAEAARALRTSLTFVSVDEPVHRVVITSSGPGEGKSFVAANLAVVYAQAGLHTILVSADLRRPRLEAIFPEAAGGPGLSGVIAGAAPIPRPGNGHHPDVPDEASALAEALRPTRVDGLHLLPCGKLPPNPAELLGSKRAGDVFERLGGLADIVIIDTPPVLVVTDAAVVAPAADAVVIVAAAGETQRGGLHRAAGVLGATPTRLVGVVLNKAEHRQRRSGYGRYYGTYYRAPEPAPSRRPWKRRTPRPEDIEVTAT